LRHLACTQRGQYLGNSPDTTRNARPEGSGAICEPFTDSQRAPRGVRTKTDTLSDLPPRAQRGRFGACLRPRCWPRAPRGVRTKTDKLSNLPHAPRAVSPTVQNLHDWRTFAPRAQSGECLFSCNKFGGFGGVRPEGEGFSLKGACLRTVAFFFCVAIIAIIAIARQRPALRVWGTLGAPVEKT